MLTTKTDEITKLYAESQTHISQLTQKQKAQTNPSRFDFIARWIIDFNP